MNPSGNSIEDFSADFSDAFSTVVFGEPQVRPCVGDDHQVEIPALIERGDYDVPFHFLLGSSVPVMWINSINKKMVQVEDKKQKFSIALVEAVDRNESSIFEDRKKRDSYGRPVYCLVPGISGDPWNDTEKASFVLGLYIFAKMFAHLKSFVECKKMDDILLFYYGEFYRSVEYSRWSSCLKRNCVFGKRIFTGPRQQELLSRLLPQVPEESGKALLKVSETFRKSNMTLEEYVSFVKAMVGVKNFIEAVAIGKGKHDLTDMAIEPVRSRQASHMRQEIPVGKACASLTHTEIVQFLTSYRLSKARSNDLFWESVSPRLLARGWHSEQPTNEPYIPGAIHSLVFLTPGITKFSKRELEKGKHYFDSVSDVLSKVRSEPYLIELDGEKDEGRKSVLYNEKQTRKAVQNHLSQQPKRDDLDNLVPVTKRHRTITGCRKTFPLVPKFGEDVYGSSSDTHNPNDKPLSQVGSYIPG